MAGYYGEVFFNSNFALDTTAGAKPNTFVGFGFPGSANTNNKDIREWAADLKHIWWSDPHLGTIQTALQYGYVERQPYFVAAGAPPTAHVHMLFSEFRYILPGT